MQRIVYDSIQFLIGLFLFLWWLLGISLAKGGWDVFWTIAFFPYAFYLVVGKAVSAGTFSWLLGG